MAIGEEMATGEVMATREAKVQNVQTTLDGGIVALTLFRTVAGHLASSSLYSYFVV